eukprot:GFUD01044083.1.p2 GENE.GFUD01044083.1~~GFUD01044083.1.p2  ORF type:complete len:174 (-),score=64.56 GFUD01044083.1:439-960(-)
MLSSISSILWGESSDQDTPAPPTTTLHWTENSPDEDDWVVVGRVAHFPGTLAGTFPLPPRSRSTSSTPSAVCPAHEGVEDANESPEVVEHAAVNMNTGRVQTGRAVAKILGQAEQRQVQSARLARQRYRGRVENRKMMRRSNKTAMACGRQGRGGRMDWQIKMAGGCRNLKQC